jgi:acetyl-CoA carboxylase biotin carboxyl carrier protein
LLFYAHFCGIGTRILKARVMDIKELQNFIRFVSKSGATEVSLETEEFKITVKTAGGNPEMAFVPSVPMTMPASAYAPVAAAPAAAPAAPAAAGARAAGSAAPARPR